MVTAARTSGRYLTRPEVLAARQAATRARLARLAAVARDRVETQMAEDQPHRCGSCGAWVPVGGRCRTPLQACAA